MRTIVSERISGQAARRSPALLLFAVWMVFSPRLGSAHVAPSVSENNRYIKLTVFDDQVRLAYIVYFGEIPGQRVRAEIDSDRDRQISPAEADAFAVEWGRRVASAMTITIGGVPHVLVWKTTELGLDDRKTSGGAFTLDLIAQLCAPSGRIELRDRLELDRIGETELTTEESPGVTIKRIALAGEDSPSVVSWNGPGGRLESGLIVEWVGEKGDTVPRCVDTVPNTKNAAPVFRYGVAALVGLVGLVGLMLFAGFVFWRLRRKNPSG